MSTPIQLMTATLVGCTDQELCDALSVLVSGPTYSDGADRLICSAVCEVILDRHPEFDETLKSWSEDLESDLDLTGLALQFLQSLV